MGAPNDSDEDGGSKKISKRETRMLLAINASESVLIDSMIAEMRNDGNNFDVEKFVEVFRKYTPHFTQMLSGEKSDDSDDEDERPLPNKYLSFLTAFSKSSDKFISAIERNYKVLYKKDLKEIDFAVFKSHPEEIFKSYEKSIGHANHSSVAVHESHANVTQPCNRGRPEEEKKTSLLGTVDDYFAKMKITNISVDTDHGSLLSAPEEELRKTIESESDTPTPTIEDWCGVSEKRRSSEWMNDNMSKSRHVAPDAVPITVPQVGQIPMCNEPRTLSSHSNLPKNGLHSSNHSSHATLSTPNLKSSNGVANIDDEANLLMNGLKDIMRDDLRFALPPMVERAVKSYLKDRRPLTLRELIGEEYADERLEKFMVRMLSKDTALMQILELEFIQGADSLIHLGKFITKDLNQNNKRGDKEHREEVEKTKEEKQVDATITTALRCIDCVNFYPDSSEHLKDIEIDVKLSENGTLVIVLTTLNVIVDNQLIDLRELDTDHLNLSNSHSLKKGKAVVLKSDNGSYCRGMVQEEWTRGSGKGTVKCILVDYGQSCNVPIDLIYAFPKWTETIPPAASLLATLKVYPIGATRNADKFSSDDWKAIGDVLNEWKENLLTVCIISREEEDEKFVIDIKNGNGESLVDELVEKGLAQKDLITRVHSTSHLHFCYLPIPPSQSLAHPRSLFFLNSASVIPSLSGDEQDEKQTSKNKHFLMFSKPYRK
ncbi:hypothetical protein PMAYCL1PPCAC_24023 [Pristionchus mayeri]|uniref:Tudor domain-containing protein n=1 Tax=Pristionchus mayeri TaxID=1317129 RepID=A0AAN5CZS2_9BILA|nr:hypothetical protein PMAYCL1PPCAC_24023 [Pristionchus mayeri]